MYNVGMLGGDFNPIHIGHINNIISASTMCKDLYVILCWNNSRDVVPKEIKYRWLLNSLKHLRNVHILLIEDKANTKEEYNENNYWEQGAIDIKTAINKPIDIVFCGSDYKGTNRFEKLYPESKVFYFDRSNIDISSTKIRNNPLKYWDYIPKISQPYYVKKVLIIGSESTGKSTLVQNLALIYNTNFVSEVGRDTCEYAGGEEFMIKEDLFENLLKQKLNVDEAIKESNKIIFVDTDALTTLFYSNFLLNNEKDIKECNDLASAICNTNKWDLILFLEPTVDFVQDGTRSKEIANNRKKYSEQIKEIFNSHNVSFEIIDNDNYFDRFEKVKEKINKLLNI